MMTQYFICISLQCVCVCPWVHDQANVNDCNPVIHLVIIPELGVWMNSLPSHLNLKKKHSDSDGKQLQIRISGINIYLHAHMWLGVFEYLLIKRIESSAMFLWALTYFDIDILICSLCSAHVTIWQTCDIKV